VGARIHLSFSLPDGGESIRAVGRVRWLRVYSESSDTGPGMGVRFEDLRPEDARRIRAFLAKRAPLFFTE